MVTICADAEQFAPGAVEGVRRGIRGVPLGNDVVVVHVRRREPRRDEVRSRGIAHRALGVHRVEQPVPREFRVKVEADEPALQPVVDGKREGGTDVRIHGRLIVAIEEVQEAARVVGEPAAVRKIADEADARPAGRHHVLIGGAQPARIRQPHDIPDLGSARVSRSEPESDCWRSALNGAGSTDRHGQQHGERQGAHKPPQVADYR